MSQKTWLRCLHKAARLGWPLKRAVIDYQNRVGTQKFPGDVKPKPVEDPVILRTKVAALYPELARVAWLPGDDEDG